METIERPSSIPTKSELHSDSKSSLHKDPLTASNSVPNVKETTPAMTSLSSSPKSNITEAFVKTVLASGLDNGDWINHYDHLPKLFIELVAFVSFLVTFVDGSSDTFAAITNPMAPARKDANSPSHPVPQPNIIIGKPVSAPNNNNSSDSGVTEVGSTNDPNQKIDRKALIYAVFYRKLSMAKDMKKVYNYIYHNVTKEPIESFRDKQFIPLIIKILSILARREIDLVLREIYIGNGSNSMIDVVVNGGVGKEGITRSSEVNLAREASMSFSTFKSISNLDLSDEHPGSKNLAWKLFEKCHVSGTHIDGRRPSKVTVTNKFIWNTMWELSNRLDEVGEAERAVNVLEGIDKPYWDFHVYKQAIRFHVDKHPSDIVSAEHLLKEYMKSVEATYKDNQGFHGEPSVPLAQGQRALPLFFLGLTRKIKWNECRRMYEESRELSQDYEHLALDNAMIDVCLSYRQFEYGWKLYENMLMMDRNTSRIVAQLCLKGFFSEEVNQHNTNSNASNNHLGKNSENHQSTLKREDQANNYTIVTPGGNPSFVFSVASDEDQGASKSINLSNSSNGSIFSISEGKMIWESRAWAFYSRFLLQDDAEIASSVVYVLHQMLEIVADSPATSSRLGKVLRIYNQLKASSCHDLVHDDYLLTPILRLCLRGVKEVEDGSHQSAPATGSMIVASTRASSNHSYSSNSISRFISFFNTSSVVGSNGKNDALSQEYFETAFQIYQDLRSPAPFSTKTLVKGIPIARKPSTSNTNSARSSSPSINTGVGDNGNSPGPVSPVRSAIKNHGNMLEPPHSPLGRKNSRSLSQPIPSLVTDLMANSSVIVPAGSSHQQHPTPNKQNVSSPTVAESDKNNFAPSAMVLQQQQKQTKTKVRVCSPNVYGILLQLCVERRDAQMFSTVCRDIVTTAVDIPQPLAKIVQDGHDSLIPHVCRGSTANTSSRCNYLKFLCPHMTESVERTVQSMFRKQTYQSNGKTTNLSFLHSAPTMRQSASFNVEAIQQAMMPMGTITEEVHNIEDAIKEAMAATRLQVKATTTSASATLSSLMPPQTITGKTTPTANITEQHPVSGKESNPQDDEDEEDPFLKIVDLQRKAKELVVHCCGCGSN